MKIIDLLKLMLERKAPKKIEVLGFTMNYVKNAHWGDYEDEETHTRLSDFRLNECLNDEIEIIEEEKELHANDIEFNINNDKKDCVITLDENDLGIDKLHLDNCYFYKENDKWYVKKYDYKSFKLEEEKKIPEKLEDISEIKCVGCKVEINIVGNKTLFDTDTPIVTEHCIFKINQLIKNQKKIIDYLKSKGE